MNPFELLPKIEDFRETTACGGIVRYTVNELDVVVYSSFNNCHAGKNCKDCIGWQSICLEYKELNDYFKSLSN